MYDENCPFCRRILEHRFVASNRLAVAFPDRLPASPGHTLVVPRRHERDLFGLSPEEQEYLWLLVADVHTLLERDFAPDGYNLGINSGRAAGQKIMHAYVHVIPRYIGDQGAFAATGRSIAGRQLQATQSPGPA